jgi:hypothetical protein
MKGVLDIEFVLSIFLFLGSISFITILIGRESLALQNSLISENLKSESYQISEILMFDKGSPANWGDPGVTINDIKRLGIFSSDYVLNSTKLAKLQSLCISDYNSVNEIITDLNINITVKNIDGTVIYRCEPQIETLRRPKFITQRVGTLDSTGEIVRLSVTLIA